MAGRGGSNREELRTLFKATGHLPTKEDDASEFLDMARSDEAEKALTNWWRLQNSAPFPIDDVMEELIIIHDDLPLDLLTNAWWCGTRDFSVKDQDFDAVSPRQAFRNLVDSRKPDMRKIFEKHDSFHADFYLPSR